MGCREQEGFVGEYDCLNGTPIPDHISAKYNDVQESINGLIKTENKLEQETEIDAVLAAAIIAFGFVFIHPFVDANGRLHRYLIYHILLDKEYVPKGLIFPVSSIILEHLDQYRQTLEAFSMSRFDFAQWRPDDVNNVQILYETIDLYRYFDATKQVEFLYSCVLETIEHTMPKEVEYLEKYDGMKDYLDNVFEMPDKMVALIILFLEQGNGRFSERTKSKEFQELNSKEIQQIEQKYMEIFW